MKYYLLAVFLGVLQTWAAFAQSVETPPQASPPLTQGDPRACQAGERATAGGAPGISPQAQPPGASENLSDKLARTDGVICPPSDIDPDIRAAAPGIGRTPVIPPPGSPGGDPSVRPK